MVLSLAVGREIVEKTLKIMVVDDTVTYRMITKKVAESIAGVQVMATVSNGKLAFDRLVSARAADLPDVVFLDVEMPVLDGISTLKKIRAAFPKISVVMVSALSRSNANIIVDCLNAGALDFVTKPLESHAERAKEALRKDLEPILSLVLQKKQQDVGAPPESVPSASAQLASRFPAAGRVNRRKTPDVKATPASTDRRQVPQKPTLRAVEQHPQAQPSPVRMPTSRPDLVLIGSSTGGPAALTGILRGLGGKSLPVPTLIVQHMPPIFTASLAMQLTRASGLVVQEATDEQTLGPGRIVLAKGGQHLTVRRKENLLMTCLTDGPKVNECRPAVDVLFMSVMTEFSGHVLAIILTGMGRDGTNGVDALKRAGKTYCITQEQHSCVVYGMPRSVDERGLSDLSLPLEQIGPKITEICFG